VTGFPNLFLALLPLVALIALVVVVRLGIRRLLRRVKRPVPINRCKCGYSLEKLSVARCPECGRVFGFDVTAEELGLTDEQLQRAQTMRMQRTDNQGNSISSAANPVPSPGTPGEG
jgi:hypothetical protein